MKCYVVNIEDYLVLVEYQDRGNLERKYISREIYQAPIKHVIIDLTKKQLNRGIEFSDVSLEDNLGDTYMGIRIREVEQAMRHAGLWKRTDYQTKPDIVSKVLNRTKYKGKLDTNTIINSAVYIKEE